MIVAFSLSWEIRRSHQSQAGLVKAHNVQVTWCHLVYESLIIPLEYVLEQQLKHQHKCVVEIDLQLDITYSFQETFP